MPSKKNTKFILAKTEHLLQQILDKLTEAVENQKTEIELLEKIVEANPLIPQDGGAAIFKPNPTRELKPSNV